MQAHYYSPSGKLGLSSLLLTPLIGGAAGAVLAFIYAYINSYNPFIYITFLATLGLAFGSATGVAVGLQQGKARNRVVAALLGLGVGVFTLYCSWAVYSFVLLQRSDVEDISLIGMFLDPIGLIGFIAQLNEQGAWSIKGTTPTGGFLWFVWAVEAAIIVGAPVVGAWGATAAPFCEKCQGWSTEMKNIFQIALPSKEEVKQRLEALDTEYVLRAPRPSDQDAAWCRFDMTQCQCKETTTISAVFVTVTPQKDKEPKVDEDTVVKNLLMPADFADQLVSAKDRQPLPVAVPA